ncbi:hypothetical protein E2553_39920 [Paraburkholderia dipogonis]|uniref:TnsA endonuclease N-terminal domain-containing protein n=1 Tax=Paraburkholderia dipogonis TaxID=1211383 RepID=A0A4Y8MJI8_9BURK|nr:hypothetical protein [Paraburkholderia dipogonis]TFE37592.1 hypothetical protein E2553_39920 [Paraburkholderia dipogonis]
MVAVLRSFEPLMLPRPRGAHRYDAFSPKLGRRLTLYRRSAFETWLMLEADPASRTFCERPGFMVVDGQRRVVDFWARSDDHKYLVLLSESTTTSNRPRSRIDFDPEAFAVRYIDAAERAAARVWTGAWQRILPVLVAARGLVEPSLAASIERFVASPQSLMAIEREFSTGDPVLVRAAVFELLHRGRIQALELHTESLSYMTRFVAIRAIP